MKPYDSEDYAEWRHRRAARRKRLAYVVIVLSLTVLCVMMFFWKNLSDETEQELPQTDARLEVSS